MYCYDSVQYINSQTHVDIICKKSKICIKKDKNKNEIILDANMSNLFSGL